MVKSEGCSESQMGSGTSRGALEWSGGKDLYMGSHILGSGKSSVFSVLYREASRRFRRVPEVSGSPRRVHMDSKEGCTSPSWAKHSSPTWPIRLSQEIRSNP